MVVDDKRSDVEKLLKLLDKRGVPYNYYYEDARSTNLPNVPLKDVRVVFLDFVFLARAARLLVLPILLLQ